jgi:hypothetical protein
VEYNRLVGQYAGGEHRQYRVFVSARQEGSPDGIPALYDEFSHSAPLKRQKKNVSNHASNGKHI